MLFRSKRFTIKGGALTANRSNYQTILRRAFRCAVFFDYPTNPPNRFVLIDRTSGGESERLPNSTVALQSHGNSKYEAMILNDDLKKVMRNMEELNEISKVSLNADYNFTDLERKQHRYQAVFDIYHY